MFKKVLQAFVNGDLPYSDVQSDLQRLLTAGASPKELGEVFHRYDSIEPVPAPARGEILRMLKEALDRVPVLPMDLDSAQSQPQEPGSPPKPVAVAAEAQTPASTGSFAATATPLSPPRVGPARAAIRGVEPGASPAEIVSSIEARIARQKADYQALNHAYERARDAGVAASARANALTAELASVRGEVAARNAAVERLQIALSEGEERLAAQQLEHAARVAALDAELARARSALDAATANDQSARGREHAQLTAALDSRVALAARLEADVQTAHAREEEALQRAQRTEAELAKLRVSLAERDAEVSKLRDSTTARQQEYTRVIAALEAHIETLEAERHAEREAARQAARVRADEMAVWTQGQQITVAIDPPPARAPATAGPAFEDEAPPPREDFRPAMATPAMTLAARSAERVDVWADARVDARQAAPGAARSPLTRGTMSRIAAIGAVLAALAAAAWIAVDRPAVSPPPVTVAAAVVPKPGEVIRDCKNCPGMTVVPAGRFKQGSDRAEGGAGSFEKPPHLVLFARPFAISTNTVTVAEFRAFIAATGRDMRGCDTYDDRWRFRPDGSWENPGFVQTGAHPVTCVSWDDARAYAAWLSKTTGHRYRLPSAAEWEYAARAGGTAVRPWNPDGAGACANANVADQRAARRYPGWAAFACDDGFVYTAPVGSFKANAFGLNDMLGNVFQWTDDCWHADYAGVPVDGSARTYGDCSQRELRGGSWFTTPDFVRASYRNHFGANYRASSVGIRLVRDLAS
jgi:formylglycine-generating enzyme required for sulfatase activity